MKESLIAAVTFWSAFAFSIGPFWIATMDAAKNNSFANLYKNYLIFLFLGWFPINFLIGILVGTIGKFNEDIYTVLYFVGSGVIFWLAYKVMNRSNVSSSGFEFNWKTMILISWTNPKVWLTIPAGYLAANFTGNLILDVILFFLISVPLFLSGVYIWGMIGRQGAKVAGSKMGYFNAALLAGFGCYLLYQGITLITASA